MHTSSSVHSAHERYYRVRTSFYDEFHENETSLNYNPRPGRYNVPGESKALAGRRNQVVIEYASRADGRT